eukprot:CAMPEP_0113524384 /NCGR_PEP_ID=MMETSP0014_2-20120614/46190_1 /TAXON_ID=2857 /ORGANISM="Nitzschia sp." /LENGTH=458 /DNA_ID=CAMNT_0000422497 /DNA_START=283 /DNA_END=1659 /DNA_ORIENTATION=+ /assembly_acc=CAM_ASM_000159
MSTSNPKQIKKSESKFDEGSQDWSGSSGVLPGQDAFGPIFLMTVCPIFSIVYVHVVTHMEGDFLEFAKLCIQEGFFTVLKEIWPDSFDPLAWKMIGGFFAFELFLQRFMPGKEFKATITPAGNVPIYKANGMQSFLFTIATGFVLEHFGYIHTSVVYDKFGEIIAALNIFSWAWCFLLLLKGHVAPSTTDSGTTGSWVYDFYWGMDLYPNILGWDVKMFTNCRAGMMFWAVGILCFAKKNQELNGGNLQLGMAVNIAIQLIYLSKFYYWEMGYMCSMDIQHDRAGFYLCWGCLVWVPAVYTSGSYYLVKHCPEWTVEGSIALFLCGALCVFINYDSDNQRYVFRQSGGKCKIWGRTPNKIIAEYTTTDGKSKKSLLLVDGWWKISRHFHYVPEILGSLCWSLPGWNTGIVGPYFYVVYLTVLLADRAFRDDGRCSMKYGSYWQEYCDQVPWKILPGVV